MNKTRGKRAKYALRTLTYLHDGQSDVGYNTLEITP